MAPPSGERTPMSTKAPYFSTFCCRNTARLHGHRCSYERSHAAEQRQGRLRLCCLLPGMTEAIGNRLVQLPILVLSMHQQSQLWGRTVRLKDSPQHPGTVHQARLMRSRFGAAKVALSFVVPALLVSSVVRDLWEVARLLGHQQQLPPAARGTQRPTPRSGREAGEGAKSEEGEHGRPASECEVPRF